jgi:hypothetical protein
VPQHFFARHSSESWNPAFDLLLVIPAKAGIQWLCFSGFADKSFRYPAASG